MMHMKDKNKINDSVVDIYPQQVGLAASAKEIIEIEDDEPSNLCPVCQSWIKANQMQEHIDDHFNMDTATNMSDDNEWRICDRCQNKVLVVEWPDHIYAHKLENDNKAHVGLSDVSQDTMVEEDRGHCSRMMDMNDAMNDSALALALQKEEENEMKRVKENEEQQFKQLQSLYGMSSKSGYAQQYSKAIDKEVSNNKLSIGDYYAKKEEMLDALISGDDSGESCTRGVIERLKGSRQTNSHIILCGPTDHFSTSYGDKQWGCGYRNLQMLLSAVLKISDFERTIRRVCKNVPSIPKIQQIIEDAWVEGFDVQGASQLGNKLTRTRKWIGATEIAVILRFLGLRANIVDFHRPTASNGNHPELFTWVQKYFNENLVPSIQQAMPLYLQHQGHSRTIIGFEQRLTKNANQNLLLFDPSHSQKQMQGLCTTKSCELKLLRKSPNQLRAKQYQVVYVDGVMDEKEWKESKVLRSTRIPP